MVGRECCVSFPSEFGNLLIFRRDRVMEKDEKARSWQKTTVEEAPQAFDIRCRWATPLVVGVVILLVAPVPWPRGPPSSAAWPPSFVPSPPLQTS